MDRESVKEFLRVVGVSPRDMVDHPKWVGVHCLLARWTHEGGVDRTPSAGVSVSDDTSKYNCFTCGARSLESLLRELEKYTGESYRELREEVRDGEFFGGVLPEWGQLSVPSLVLPTPLDTTQFRDIYDLVTAHPYLQGERGIHKRTARWLELRIDPSDSQGAERILFPVHTPSGDFVGFTGRAVRKDVQPKVRDYHGLVKEACLLGSHLRAKGDQQIVIVEGPFDYAKVVQAGFYCVAVLHSGLTDIQVSLLREIGLPVVLMYDNDVAGRKGTKVALQKLAGSLPVSVVEYPTDATWSGADPGSCDESEVQALIADAEPA